MEKNTLLSVLADEAEQERMIFPAPVNAAINIKEKLEDLDCNLDFVILLLQDEPLLSKKVMAVANSVVFNRSGRRITSLREAVTLIGMQTVRNLAAALVAHQLAELQSKSKRVAQL